MGETRDFFKNVRDTKGTFHAKMGTLNDRNGVNLTEAECWEEVVRIYRRTIQKRSQWTDNSRCDLSPRARHPGVQSQVGLWKHHYEKN